MYLLSIKFYFISIEAEKNKYLWPLSISLMCLVLLTDFQPVLHNWFNSGMY